MWGSEKKFRVAYFIGEEPTRMIRMDRGFLTIDANTVIISGSQDVSVAVSEIQSLSFRRKIGLFHIILEADPCVFITPTLFSVPGCVQFVLERRHTAVYTELHRLLRGPGRCAKCNYDMRVSALPCPDCGCDRVRPI